MPHPALNPDFLLAPVEDGYVAYDPASDRLHRLNPMAALIAELCNGERSVEEIQSIVEPLLPAGSAAEVERCIREGIASGLFTASGDGASPARDLSSDDLAELARTLRKNGKVQSAFLCQQRAAELAPDDAQKACYLGELAHIVGRRADARAAYERYIELEPDDAEVRHLLVSLRDDAPPPRVPDECIQQLYERFSEFYEANVCDELEYQGPETLAKIVKSQLGDRSGLATLDLGCGTGLGALRFGSYAARLVGIDLSPEMVELARDRKLYDRLEVAEITDWLARCEERFELVIACDSFIYFGDLRQVIPPAARLLQDGGLFAFTVERGERHPYRLTDNGRYTHHPDHIREVALEAGLAVAHLEETFLRMEYGEEVTGLFAVLSAPEVG